MEIRTRSRHGVDLLAHLLLGDDAQPTGCPFEELDAEYNEIT